jgi:hypothetical protein
MLTGSVRFASDAGSPKGQDLSARAFALLFYSADAYSAEIEGGTRYKTGYAVARRLEGRAPKRTHPRR